MTARFARFPLVSALLFACGVLVGCGSSSSTNDAAQTGGGPVTGALDDHCTGVTPIVVNEASCHPVDTSPPDGGAEEQAPVMYNAQGDDDDCKYHVSFTNSAVSINQSVTFNVTATLLAPPAAGNPATGADIVIESYLADNQLHVLPNSGTKTTESPAGSGKYSITPVKFDASGRWVVRFHLYEDCDDTVDDSPHGHAAFYFDVP